MNLPSQEAIDFASQKVQSDERGITRIEGVPFLKLDNLTQSPNNQAMVDGITIALARLFDEYLDTVLDECDCELEADMAIDADGEPFDLNRCHNPNCPSFVPPVYEVGCDCSNGEDVTVISWMRVEPRTYSILPRLLDEVRKEAQEKALMSKKRDSLIREAITLFNEQRITRDEYAALIHKIDTLS